MRTVFGTAGVLGVCLSSLLGLSPASAGGPPGAAPQVRLRYACFDPIARRPAVEPELAADADTSVYLVQLAPHAQAARRAAIERLGGAVRGFVPDHSLIVQMEPAARAAVAELSFVRWIGPLHPVYRLDQTIRAQLSSPTERHAPGRCGVQVFERGLKQQRTVAARIGELGGTVHHLSPGGFRMEATLTPEQACRLAHMDEVAFIDPCGVVELDMDIARELGGANYVDTVGGYTGAGVRGEVFDTGILHTHHDLQSNPVIFHTANGTPNQHGTAVMGIAFGDGTVDPQGRGLLPDGRPIFAYYQGVPDIYQHFAELVDPAGPYRAVFQTNSTGHPRTKNYTTISARTDDLLFLHDIVLTQTQGNGWYQDSRPEAWAKNAVSVGGTYHYDTLTLTDDCWCEGASTGPATDGRIKPDFTHFFDQTFTISSDCDTCYTSNFGGSSGATPIVAGHFGLMFQMWNDGIFGNVVDPNGTVFENRPHMTTAKALMIATATQYPFAGAGHDLSRIRQGWGLPDLRQLYDGRDKLFIINEQRVLEDLETAVYELEVPTGRPELKIAMTYADPPGYPGAALHRVNDLTLRVTSPSRVVYWGNHGLEAGNYSLPGGEADIADTVECVFVLDPEPGVWLVEVLADEINEDGHPETPELDADFALVACGVRPWLLGDMNCDRLLDFGDINPFVLALVNPAAYASTYPACNIMLADMNLDGAVDFGDINPFVKCIACPGCQCEWP